MISFEVKNRFSGKVQFVAEIDCDESRSHNFKLGLAVRWAIRSDANLSYADLRGADLRGANLRYADLRGADLRGANLGGANLRYADLSGANLIGANLRGANLSYADLSDADLRGADLRGANLSDADLGGANLSGADLIGANLSYADLSRAYLRDADLGGLSITQGPIRQDGYQYILYTSALGGCVIRAGCRTWIGEDAIEQARAHCLQETDAKNRPQALRIVDYLEGELKVIRALDAFGREAGQ